MTTKMNTSIPGKFSGYIIDFTFRIILKYLRKLEIMSVLYRAKSKSVGHFYIFNLEITFLV